MHKPESVRENTMYEILRDFEMQTDHLIPTRILNLIINKKENSLFSGLYHNSGSAGTKEAEKKKRRVLRPCQRTKKTVKQEDDGDANVIGTLGTVPNGLERGLEK